MGTADEPIGGHWVGEKVAGNPLVSTEKGAVHMGGEEADGAGEVLQHIDGQVGVEGKDPLQVGAVDGDEGTGRHSHGRGHTGLTVKEGGLTNEVSGVVEGEGALVPIGRTNKTLHRARYNVMKLKGIGALDVDELSRIISAGALSFSEREPNRIGCQRYHHFPYDCNIFYIQDAIPYDMLNPTKVIKEELQRWE